jgi:prephenate dehydrogenase
VKSVRIVGSGLIGTSIGLALSRNDCAIEMRDKDLSRSALAQSLVGAPPAGDPSLIILAVPTSSLSEVIAVQYQLNPRSTFIDIASTKTKSQEIADSFSGFSERFCATHPMAGREIAGPESARADLFQGRPWIYSPNALTATDVLEDVLWLIGKLGAQPFSMTVEEHDEAVALVSHLPQIGSSLVAGLLRDAKPEFLALSGQGLRDTTRIASSDSAMWSEIISDNREYILPLLRGLSSRINELIASADDPDVVEKFIEDGKKGRKGIPGKHGGVLRNYSFLPIVIEDKPGQLAALFHECAEAKVNIEDLSIEHSPGQFTGLITLALSEGDATILAQHLGSRGWSVHEPRK